MRKAQNNNRILSKLAEKSKIIIKMQKKTEKLHKK